MGLPATCSATAHTGFALTCCGRLGPATLLLLCRHRLQARPQPATLAANLRTQAVCQRPSKLRNHTQCRIQLPRKVECGGGCVCTHRVLGAIAVELKELRADPREELIRVEVGHVVRLVHGVIGEEEAIVDVELRSQAISQRSIKLPQSQGISRGCGVTLNYVPR